MNVLLTILAILPGLIIAYLIYRFDKHEKESKLALAISFGIGVLSAFPALWIEQGYDNLGVNEFGSFWNLLLLSFVSIALTEELVKFIALMAYPFPKKFFNEPMDGIVYAVMIGMGFATIENIFYAYRFGTGTVLVRAFTAVPAHAIFAIMMGYFVGLAKFDKKNRIRLLAYGLGIAVLVHGIYDVFILQKYHDWIMLLATLTLVVGGFFCYRFIRTHQQNSPFIQEESIVEELPEENIIIEASAPITEVTEERTTSSSDDDIMNSIISDMQGEEE